MLKNKKVVYFCQECGYESSKWMGQCPGCRAWNTFVEETVSTKKVSSTGSSLQNGLRRAEPVVLKDIRLSEDERKLTNIGELDRVLGGGIVPGSLVLVGGDPGIGNPPFFYRFAEIWRCRVILYYIYQVKNLCVRLNYVLNVLESSMRISSYYVRQIWKQSER